MNGYLLRSFELPSRFTFLERHVMAIKVLSRCLPPRDAYAILNVGPGVFEPFVLGSIMETYANKRVQLIDAVDQDSRVCDMLTRLVRRESVPVEEIAAVSTNFDADGTPHRNGDLASVERLTEAVATLEGLKIPVASWFLHNYRMFLPEAFFPIQIWQKDIASFIFSISAGMYDMAFFGAVLVNIIKVQPSEQIAKTFRSLHNKLSPGAVLGITTTPKEFLESVSTLHSIQSSGFRLVCIFAERLVILPNDEAPYIHGDIVAIFQRKEDSLNLGARELREELHSRLSSYPNVQVVQSATWKRTFNDRWHDRWLPVGWIPDHESGCEFLLDLDQIQPGDQFICKF